MFVYVSAVFKRLPIDRVLPPVPAISKSPTILLPASNDSVLPVPVNRTAPAVPLIVPELLIVLLSPVPEMP